MRVTIRVKPGSSRSRVGGTFGEDQLVVAVPARAVDGAATEAALLAVAGALDVHRRDITLVTGATARTKVVDISTDDPAALASRLDVLLQG